MTPKIAVTNRASSALVAAEITSINGTYGSACADHTDGDPWSASPNGGSLAHPELYVIKNNATCRLTVTEVVVGSTVYGAGPAIELAQSYAEEASAFKDDVEDPVDFYGNARIDSLAFSADFTIDVIVSDDPNTSISGSKQGTFATQSSTVVVGNVDAPNDTVDLSAFALTTDIDDVVAEVSGFATLNVGSRPGDDYAIHHGQLSGAASPETIADAYDAATKKGEVEDGLQIAAADFALGGEDLTSGPARRTLIVRATAEGVTSYQLIVLSFSKP
ncbi:MAG: hypothetical protein KIT84_36315 [Labilithrix sp.]|nr:hypothetical protein [Labilithrix sp.]MCW5816520.1 hypothetical protein [Labilithrix sp.]